MVNKQVTSENQRSICRLFTFRQHHAFQSTFSETHTLDFFDICLVLQCGSLSSMMQTSTDLILIVDVFRHTDFHKSFIALVKMFYQITHTSLLLGFQEGYEFLNLLHFSSQFLRILTYTYIIKISIRHFSDKKIFCYFQHNPKIKVYRIVKIVTVEGIAILMYDCNIGECNVNKATPKRHSSMGKIK